MKKNTIVIIILFSIAIGLCILIVEYHKYLRQLEEKELTDLIEQLQIKNDSLKLRNELLDTQINIQIAKADSLQKEVKSHNKIINKLKQIKNETIISIDSMDSSKLLEFFADFETQSSNN